VLERDEGTRPRRPISPGFGNALSCFFPPLREEQMRRLGILTLISICAVLSGCAHRSTHNGGSIAAVAPALQGDPAHPEHASKWVETRLYFGLGPADHPEQGVSEPQWRDFLDKEVTPRFPDGLSVVDVYGQWEGKNETAPERLRSKLLIIDYPDNAANGAKVDAIRAAWKQRTGDESVLKVTEPVEVSF